MALRFTFQSGDIQITFGQISSTFESAFTFQSGEIITMIRNHNHLSFLLLINVYISIFLCTY